MSKILWYILAGAVSGILGGMGMGGGVLLIPILTQLLQVEQKVAQGINLIAFLPMSIAAIIVHAKNKEIKLHRILWLILPAVLSCFLASNLAISSRDKVLKICYGIFLTLIGIAQGVSTIVNIVKAKKSPQNSSGEKG